MLSLLAAIAAQNDGAAQLFFLVAAVIALFVSAISITRNAFQVAALLVLGLLCVGLVFAT